MKFNEVERHQNPLTRLFAGTRWQLTCSIYLLTVYELTWHKFLLKNRKHKKKMIFPAPAESESSNDILFPKKWLRFSNEKAADIWLNRFVVWKECTPLHTAQSSNRNTFLYAYWTWQDFKTAHKKHVCRKQLLKCNWSLIAKNVMFASATVILKLFGWFLSNSLHLSLSLMSNKPG